MDGMREHELLQPWGQCVLFCFCCLPFRDSWKILLLREPQDVRTFALAERLNYKLLQQKSLTPNKLYIISVPPYSAVFVQHRHRRHAVDR